MRRIEDIYRLVFQELPDSQAMDHKLSERIEAEINGMNIGPEDKDKAADMMYAGSSHGQAIGFISGFRFAMALIIESLV